MSPNPTTRGYPLIALFLILTACAIVAALVGPAVRGVMSAEAVSKWDVLLSIVFSGLSVMCIGGMVGLFHYHRGVGFLWGILVGGVVGLFVGPMIIGPRSSLPTLFGLSVGGAVVVGMIALAYRIAARRPSSPH